ncbi:hypothetical protein ACJ2A9_13210 [Anaerobacillus sp. MEB173]|uniref:hypothetical protein n=1 Tax=Anaerobacillus sp. MEB173 TaxID=3383345 RepID=UPI003F92F23C
MRYDFVFDKRLGISIPLLGHDWDAYDDGTQADILLQWEIIRGRIPDRIAELEFEINRKQSQLNREENFIRSCILNDEISELASTINDLWIWYRMNQHLEPEIVHQ